MQSTIKKILMSSIVPLLSVNALATPVVNSSDRTKINVPVGYEGSEWFRGANRSDLYVAPPVEGKVSLLDYVPQNASFCTDLKRVRATEQSTLSTYLLLTDQVNSIAIRYGEYQYEIDGSGNVRFDADGRPVYRLDADGNRLLTEFGIALTDARKDSSEKKLVEDEKFALFERAEDDARAAKSLRDDLRDFLNDCKEDARVNEDDWREVCSDEYDEYRDARSEYRSLRRDARDAEDDYFSAQFAYKRAKAINDDLEDEQTETSERIANIRIAISVEKENLKNLYREIAGIFGGQVNLSYRSEWDKLINAYSRANPDKSIRRVSVYNPILNVPTTDEYLANNPGLSQTVGIAWSYLNIANTEINYDFTEVPDGEVIVNEKQQLPGWPNAFQGNVGLFLPNACVMQEGTKGLTGSLLLDAYSRNFNQYLTPSISYSYDVRADFGYSANYNLSQFLKIIKKVTKRRGFFSSRTKNEMEKEFNESKAFVMKFNNDARNNALSEAEKNDLKGIVRARLVKQVLDSVGRRAMSQDPTVSFVPTSEPALSEMSSKLRGYCRWGWGYQCLGGWAFYTIGGIFGTTTTALATFEERNNFRAYENVTDSFFVEYDRAISFIK